MKKRIVLYDGVCLFCEGWVNTVIKNSSYENCPVFIPLQYVKFNTSIDGFDSDGSADYNSIIVIDLNSEVLLNSNASLKIIQTMKFPFNVFGHIGAFFPLWLRNYVYNFIGKNRYRIWGKKDYCSLPTDHEMLNFPCTDEALKLAVGSEKVFELLNIDIQN